VAYRCNEKNYCADLTSIIKGCEWARKQSISLWCEPMEKHIATYDRSGGVFVKFGYIDFGLSFFKEFDGVRKLLVDKMSKEDYAHQPFINEQSASHEAREKYTSRIPMNFRPKDFEKVGFPDTGYDLTNCGTPSELIAAHGRRCLPCPENFIPGLASELSVDGTLREINFSYEDGLQQLKM